LRFFRFFRSHFPAVVYRRVQFGATDFLSS